MLRLSDALLQQVVWGFVQSVGLNPAWGSLHVESGDVPPLVSDLAAEWSSAIAHEFAANLVISQMLTPWDFAPPNGRRDRVYPHALKTFVQQWEKKLQGFVTIQGGEPMSYRQCIQMQVREYLASVLGAVEYYQPMLVKLSVLPAPAVAVQRQAKRRASRVSDRICEKK